MQKLPKKSRKNGTISPLFKAYARLPFFLACPFIEMIYMILVLFRLMQICVKKSRNFYQGWKLVSNP